MTLAELRQGMVAHGVTLHLLPDGRVKPCANHAPPPELIAAMRDHREALIRQLHEGRGMDGRLGIAALSRQPFHCGTCVHFKDDPEWGAWMGICAAPPQMFPPGEEFLAIHAAHRCVTLQGQGWLAKGGTP